MATKIEKSKISHSKSHSKSTTSPVASHVVASQAQTDAQASSVASQGLAGGGLAGGAQQATQHASSVERRAFLGSAAAVGALTAVTAASSFPKPAIAQDVKEIRLVTTWPKGFPGLGTGAQRFGDRITATSGGRLKVSVFGAGELVPALEVHDAVSNGVAEMYHGTDYYFTGKSPAYSFYSAVPMGFGASEQNGWILHGGGKELWDEVGKQFGVKHLICGNTGVQMGGWFRKEIKTLDDLRGLKMRIPGLGGEVLRRLGVSTVLLAGGEIFGALQSGAIDATEWVGPWNDLSFGFYKITKFYYWPGFHEPGTTLGVGVNLKFWEGLSDADRSLITNCALAENSYMHAEFIANDATSLDVLVKKHGVELRRFSDEILTAIGNASGEVVREIAEKDDLSKRVLESYMKFREITLPYTKVSEKALFEMRELPFKY